MSDPEHMEAAEQDRHYILHDIIACSLNKILHCLCLVGYVYVTARLLTVDPFVNRSTGL